jgi:D-alanine-D-alanine ligase
MAVRRFQKVAVLMGGPSAERDVSLRSGRAVAGGLRQAGYQAREVTVEGRRLDLPPDVEAVFIALHGEFGEDGEVQALLEERGIPFTGSGFEASRAAFDKRISKRIFVENGIPTPAFEVRARGEAISLPLPVVVKPARQGSSIGAHRVFQECEKTDALRDALSYDPEALVERYIDGRELTVGIVEHQALPVIEIVAPGGWYGYEAKYTAGACRYLVPAPLPEETAERCREIALRVFYALGCRGFARVDFRCSADGELHVLELNSIPGFTETSLLPKAAAAAGISFPALCDRILSAACCAEAIEASVA